MKFDSFVDLDFGPEEDDTFGNAESADLELECGQVFSEKIRSAELDLDPAAVCEGARDTDGDRACALTEDGAGCVPYEERRSELCSCGASWRWCT